MLECPLCGADNPITAKTCHVCETGLSIEHNLTSSIPIDTVDATRSYISWPVIRAVALVVILLAIPWVLMSDLLVTPRRVTLSRQGYATLIANFNKQPDHWREVKQKTLSSIYDHRADGDITKRPLVLNGVSLEALVPLLTDDLGMTNLMHSSFSCYPVGTSSHLGFILSKKEEGVWPLRIILSLEINLSESSGKIVPQLVRLRRGSRTVPIELAPLYFKDELEAFAKLHEVTGTVRNIAISEENNTLTSELEALPFKETSLR